VNEVRIIGGKWKRRKLAFPNRPALRPTPDRARETLFNWLAPRIEGARCLDLFAGSGALGFEALSRGAEKVVFVDADPVVVRSLRENRAILGATECEIFHSRALDFLHRCVDSWDVVFLDPPFATDLLEVCLAALAQGDHLRDGAIVYVESSIHHTPELAHWQTIKSSRTGAVASRLLERCV
jgi:16S rRNA (guanine966-N2)-methyltransferase